MARRLDKPIRLYVLAIFVSVAYGLMPLVSVFPFTGGYLLVGPIFLPFNGSIQVLYGPDGEAPELLILVSVFLCVFSVISALAAFAGFWEGRAATLLFVTLNVLWWTFLVIMMIVGSERPGITSIGFVIDLLLPFIWLAFVWWNFTRPEIGAYYRQQSELTK